MNRKERVRFERSLLIICGVWHTLDQWNRVLLPFSQWSLTPRPGILELLTLNAIASTFVFIGTFLMAQMIESYGLRRTAILATLMTGIYQISVCRIKDYWLFAAFQSVLIFNHVPMVIDSSVVHLEGEDGDDKRRTQFLNRLTIPMSIGIAAGPYMALQVLFRLTSSLDTSQTMCGVASLLVLLPISCFYVPDTVTRKPLAMPSLQSYRDMLQNRRTICCLVLLMMVFGPYCAYDQVIRISLTATVIRHPENLNLLFLVLGGTSIAVNVWLVPVLQEKCGPQKVLMTAFGLLSFSYMYLSSATSYATLLVGMPIQVVGVSICLGELSSQVLSTVGKGDCGKAAALIRMAHMLATMMTPLVTGAYVDRDETSILCYVSAVVSLAAIPILAKYGQFMKTHSAMLPISGKLD